MELWREELKQLKSNIKNAQKGLPEDVFEFASSITPMINVDLLIKNSDGAVLLAWRDDSLCGHGWHIPGGIIRFKETIDVRIQAVAMKELGTPVLCDLVPVAMNQIIVPSEIRGHFISLLYRCILPQDYEVSNQAYRKGDAGFLQWHAKMPDNMVQGQNQVYGNCWDT